MKTWKLSFLLMFTLASCQFNKSHNIDTPKIDTPKEVPAVKNAQAFFNVLGNDLAVNEITIINDQFQPLIDAEVMVGTAENSPFPGNIFRTNKEGKFEIPSQWNTPLPVTITAQGHIKATYTERTPESQLLQVKVNRQVRAYEVKGKTLGYKNLKKDGFVDFSLVSYPLTQDTALNFDLNKIISPEVDVMKVLSYEVKVPSNIAIPKQKEKYSFFTVTLDKPVYRTYFSDGGNQSLMALRSRFPFKKVVDKMREGASFFDVINDFSFESMEVRDFTLKGKTMQLDLNTDQYPLTAKTPITAPAFESDSTMISVGMVRDGARYLPADIKKLDSGQTMNLSVPQGQDIYALSILTKKKKAFSSINIDPQVSVGIQQVNGSPALLLDRIEQPQLSKKGIILDRPANKTGISPVSTYAALATIEVQHFTNYDLKERTIQWEVYADGWVNELNLPEAFIQRTMKAESEWNVAFYGRSGEGTPLPLGPTQIQDTTHVTRNATKF